MNTDPPEDGALNSPGTPTLYAARERALELALIHGRSVAGVSASDCEQVLLELTVNPKAAL